MQRCIALANPIALLESHSAPEPLGALEWVPVRFRADKFMTRAAEADQILKPLVTETRVADMMRIFMGAAVTPLAAVPISGADLFALERPFATRQVSAAVRG